ncbi:MAG TPA: DUF4345 family protein, partial [Acetobacteraceae bacterium]|nr:DUF4345 family protein [Acetobacteraceae bacterium]
MSFPLALRLTAMVAVLVGLTHLIFGLGADVMLGAHIPPATLADPVLDSQNRFYGVAFAGYGALLWLAASDIWRHATLIRVLAAFVFLGGVARLW